jgi:hypothetical protein
MVEASNGIRLTREMAAQHAAAAVAAVNVLTVHACVWCTFMV